MKIEFREAKSILTKSNIPNVDYVANPYTGCQHGCIYCYAEFMKRFTNHKGDVWGKFLDVKQFDESKIKPHKFDDKTILLSSVTDPYIPLELKYKNTRKILERLVGTKAEITILTKSKFFERDVDLFKQFENIEVGISICSLNDDFAKKVEKGASRPSERLKALKNVHERGVNTWLFISPFFPRITDYKEIIERSKDYVNSYMFENLNFRPHNIPRILSLIKSDYPELLDLYNSFRKDPSLWEEIEVQIDEYCRVLNINFSIEFHHGGFSKS